MKFYFISGETSGDQHAAEIIRKLKDKGSHEFKGIGGAASRAAGMDIVINQDELSFMGFIEVVKNLSIIRKSLNRVKQDLREWKPDRLVLIDYPGFNLRIATYAKKLGIPVHYYIAPKVWAWNEKRIHKIKASVDSLYCILPFEETYFRNAGINAHYVGNPSWEKVRNDNQRSDPDPKLIALLPGSRKQEVSNMLPIMIRTIQSMKEYRFKVAKAPGLNESFYRSIAGDIELDENMYDLLRSSGTALVTSGTATLETALLNIPQVVCYKTSAISYRLAKWFVKLPYISLVNIILNKHAVCELIQADLNQARLLDELQKLWSDSQVQKEMMSDYEALRQRLGDLTPSEVVSNHILTS